MNPETRKKVAKLARRLFDKTQAAANSAAYVESYSSGVHQDDGHLKRWLIDAQGEAEESLRLATEARALISEPPPKTYEEGLAEGEAIGVEKGRVEERKRGIALAAEMHGYSKERQRREEAHAYQWMGELLNSGKSPEEAFGGDYEGHTFEAGTPTEGSDK